MHVKPWSSPVRIEMAPGRIRIIGSTIEAATFLLKDWPPNSEHIAFWARRICLEASAGLLPDEDARAAFLIACRDAGVRLIPQVAEESGMDVKIWSRPVRFETSVGQYRIIASTEEASRFLLHQWPMQNGVAYDAARQACLDAMEGEVPADIARQAFIEACGEAGMYVME